MPPAFLDWDDVDNSGTSSKTRSPKAPEPQSYKGSSLCYEDPRYSDALHHRTFIVKTSSARICEAFSSKGVLQVCRTSEYSTP